MVKNSIPNFKGALYCKLEGRGFDSRWCHWNFSMTQFSGRTVPLELTQRLAEMSTRNISWEVKTAGNQLTTFTCRLSRNLGVSDSWKIQGLPKPVDFFIYLTLNIKRVTAFTWSIMTISVRKADIRIVKKRTSTDLYCVLTSPPLVNILK